MLVTSKIRSETALPPGSHSTHIHSVCLPLSLSTPTLGPKPPCRKEAQATRRVLGPQLAPIVSAHVCRTLQLIPRDGVDTKAPHPAPAAC